MRQRQTLALNQTIGRLAEQDVNASNKPLNFRDLELLHNFVAYTSMTMSSQPTIKEFWRTTAPRLALRAEYVMRGILAVSALHTAYNHPTVGNVYQVEAMSHYQIGSRQAMEIFNDGNPKEHLDFLFTFSILTTAFGKRRSDGFRELR